MKNRLILCSFFIFFIFPNDGPMSTCLEQSEGYIKEKHEIPINNESVNFKNDLMSGLRLAVRLCDSCHGKSVILSQKLFPSLNGQKPKYIYHQLVAFKLNNRSGSVMSNISKELSEKSMSDVAKYYSSLEPIKLYDSVSR